MGRAVALQTKPRIDRRIDDDIGKEISSLLGPNFRLIALKGTLPTARTYDQRRGYGEVGGN
eukprot:scaffold2421_cov145-Skeletonema_marinoi.AAC.3